MQLNLNSNFTFKMEQHYFFVTLEPRYLRSYLWLKYNKVKKDIDCWKTVHVRKTMQDR